MKRPHNKDGNALEFFIHPLQTASSPLHFEVRNLSCKPKKRADDEELEGFYALYLKPAVPNIGDYKLVVHHQGMIVFSTPLCPKTRPAESISLLDRVYPVYETHQLCQNEDGSKTYAIYIQMEDVNLTAGCAPIMKPAVEMSFFLQRQGHLRRLPFYPPDVDVQKYGLKLDTRVVPQRTPLWFAVRGDVSGTKAYKLMGFWVPTVEQNPNWSYDAEEVFSEESRLNMRHGAQSEDLATIFFHKTNANAVVSNVGWCKTSKPYPGGWGASPDGLICDDTMNWTRVPESIRKYYEDDDSLFDIKQGVLEIKTSKRSLAMEAYYYPQVYMEMIATNTVWCDLARFYRSAGSPPSYSMRVYRVYRHKPTEEKLVRMIRYALANKHRLQTLVQEAEYKEMRSYFVELAKKAPYKEFGFTPDIQASFAQYASYKKHLLSF